MGVTLERVQNKFACIIGELCNEPDVLSQFAIWVDLRIAEYKLKGAISLDCSGEDVSPSWLRGYKPSSRNRVGGSFSSPHRNALSPSLQRSWSQEASPSRTGFDRLNSAVKTEHIESSVFPVGVERNENSRKRSHTDSNTHYSPHDMPMSKSPRYDHSLSPGIIAEPTNESLMSIIGMGDNGGSDNPSASMDDPDISIVMDGQNQSHAQSTSTPSAASGGGYRGGYSMSHPSTSSSDGRSGTRRTPYWDPWKHATPSHDDLTDNFQFPNMSQHPHTQKVKLRFPNLKQRSAKHTGLILGAVGTLECWLSQTQDEHRNIEDIPPEQFDSYLVTFFEKLKKKDGTEYNPESLMNYRGRLMTFLIEKQYPCNINKSNLFAKSRDAFRRKLHYLRKKWSSECRQQTFYSYSPLPAHLMPVTMVRSAPYYSTSPALSHIGSTEHSEGNQDLTVSESHRSSVAVVSQDVIGADHTAHIHVNAQSAPNESLKAAESQESEFVQNSELVQFVHQADLRVKRESVEAFDSNPCNIDSQDMQDTNV